jgi:transposase
VVLQMLANVQQKTIKPLFEKFVKAGSMVNSDEYVIYDRLEAWGYGHVSVNHSAGEFARDADGDGVNEVHVNTLEGFWSLLRSWLRVHRGISQERLPLYLGFFGVVHNVRLRGRALLGSLLALLLVPGPCNP